MKSLKVLLIASMLLLATVGIAVAQGPAYTTPFITSVTYQNISNTSADVVFYFYAEGSATATQVPVTLAANAGASLFIGGLNQLPANFSGSAVVSSSQPIVATLVQIPQSTTVRNRPVSNGFSSASSSVTIATVLKSSFGTSTKFSVQNTESVAADIKITFYNADNPAATPIVVNRNNVPGGSAVSLDMGTLADIAAASFNGSAIVEATRTGGSTPANIVASALELATGGPAARAFEGVNQGAQTVYMPSALCNFASATSAYAVTNASQTQGTTVTVTFNNGNTVQATLAAGSKASINGCDGNNPNNYSGSATITSDTTDIVVIGKVGGGGRSTAFLGESTGSAKLALPYVRWTEAQWGQPTGQRASIAIQNIGPDPVSGVVVKYLNATGQVVGQHALPTIASGAKKNSSPRWSDAEGSIQLQPGFTAINLEEFGRPDGNPTGAGFGGSVIIEGPSGSELTAVVRIASRIDALNTTVAEDYNGIAIQ